MGDVNDLDSRVLLVDISRMLENVLDCVQQAMHGVFPKRSSCSENCARVLIHVKCHGNGYQNGDKFAFPYLKFQTILTDALDIKVLQKYRCDVPAIGPCPRPRPS
eukprot:325894-Prorocentrum_minimum.AAC.4